MSGCNPDNISGNSVKLINCEVRDNKEIGILIEGDDCMVFCGASKTNTDGIRITGNNCNISQNRCYNNSLAGLHIATGVTGTIAVYNNLLGNNNNIVDNGTLSDTTGCKI